MTNALYDHVSRRRLRRDIERNARFGALDTTDGHGRTVLTGTDANRRAREYLVERLRDAGLAVTVDRVGNIAGRWTPESADPDAAPVAAGSHLDSVPTGGIFDGPLGVYAALEAVRALQSADVAVERPVDVVSFTEEEGTRFSEGILGSSVAAGGEDVERLLATTDESGTTLGSELDRIGFRGEGRIDASRWDAWLELHVEQGTVLEQADAAVGVVTSITGTVRSFVELTGEADHAGTTGMAARTDALAAASELVLAVERTTNEVRAEQTPTAVGTVGTLSLEPDAINVVPGTVELGIDVRADEMAAIETVTGTIEGTLSRLERERGVGTSYAEPYVIEPVPMDQRCQSALQAGADGIGAPVERLHSGAGHDTMALADATDVGMLFVESRDGASHSPREWTDWADCELATQVLTGGLATLAT